MKVSDVDKTGAFWSNALGYERQSQNPAFLVPDGAPGTRLHLDDEDRTRLDLWADDEADQQVEVERLISLGAQRVDWEYPDDADFIVLADPDGNCSASSREPHTHGIGLLDQRDVRTSRGPSGFSFRPSFHVANNGVGCGDEFGAIGGCAGTELEQCLKRRRVTSGHNHALRLTEQDHYFVVGFGSVEQSLELTQRVVGGTSVFARPLAVMSRGISVLTGTLAVTGCSGAIIGRAAALLGVIAGLVQRGGIASFGGLIPLVCCTVSLSGDVITLGGTFIIDLGPPVPIGEIIQFSTSHSASSAHRHLHRSDYAPRGHTAPRHQAAPTLDMTARLAA